MGRTDSPSKPPPPPIPAWAWVFVVACAAIPAVSLGGGIPTGIGAAGAFGCVAVARNPERAVGARVGICVAITAACWAVFVAFVIWFVGFVQG